MARGCLYEAGEEFRVYLRVSPGAKRGGIKGLYGEQAVRLCVASPCEKGRANAEAEGVLAQVFGVGVSVVEMVRGASGQGKVTPVRGYRWIKR